jgi:ERCC4-type nuclease
MDSFGAITGTRAVIESAVITSTSSAPTEVVVDYRERGCDGLAVVGATVRRDRLDIGDYVISRGGAVRCVIERKTPVDLLSSLRDGRWERQVANLSELPDGVAMVVVVGKFDSMDSVDRHRCLCALTRLVIQHRHVVQFHLQCASYFERWLCDMVFALEHRRGVSIPMNRVRCVAKTQRGSADNPRSVHVNQLTCVQGVSVKLAQAIVMRFPTVWSLVEEVRKRESGAIKYLSEIKFIGTRRLGPVVAKRLAGVYGPSKA